jgi:hypothetical protein
MIVSLSGVGAWRHTTWVSDRRLAMTTKRQTSDQTIRGFFVSAIAAGHDHPSRETDMQVSVSITKIDAIRAGINAGVYTIDIDSAQLSQAERDCIADKVQADRDGRLFGPTRPTAEAIIEWARNMVHAQTEAQVKAAADLAARTEAWLTAPLESCIVAINGDAKIASNMWCDAPTASWATSNTAIDMADPRVVVRMSILEPMRLARQLELDAQAAEAKRRKAAADAAAAAAAKAAEEALRKWSADHGSELLQERIAGGYNYKSLARREYAQSIAAKIGGDWIVEPQEWECKSWANPTLSAIRARKAALAAVRAVADGPGLLSIELLIVSVPSEDEAEDAEAFAALKALIRCPDGATEELVQRLP